MKYIYSSHFYFKSLFASISNHMAKSVKREALVKEKNAARAFIDGMCPVVNQ
jgi:hypothetical protein